jgi:hypothetical protein
MESCRRKVASVMVREEPELGSLGRDVSQQALATRRAQPLSFLQLKPEHQKPHEQIARHRNHAPFAHVNRRRYCPRCRNSKYLSSLNLERSRGALQSDQKSRPNGGCFPRTRAPRLTSRYGSSRKVELLGDVGGRTSLMVNSGTLILE